MGSWESKKRQRQLDGKIMFIMGANYRLKTMYITTCFEKSQMLVFVYLKAFAFSMLFFEYTR